MGGSAVGKNIKKINVFDVFAKSNSTNAISFKSIDLKLIKYSAQVKGTKLHAAMISVLKPYTPSLPYTPRNKSLPAPNLALCSL